MKALIAIFVLSISMAHAYDGDFESSESDDNFNVESARDVLDGGDASDEFLAAKERLQISEDRANLSDEEAAMMMLSNSSEIN